MKLIFKRCGSVPTSFSYEKTDKTSFLQCSFQSSLLKHAGEFFFLRNADFVKFGNASELSWEKALLIRVLYREQVMRRGWSATLMC